MKLLVTGGAGFIGSHLNDFLLAKGHEVIVFDNLSWGKKKFIFHNLKNPRFKFIQIDLLDYRKLLKNLDENIDTVFHLAANSDIMRGMETPDIDFDNTLVATFNLLKALREKGIKKIFFTSGSGVYGNFGSKFASESHGPLLPVSMYGATKLGAEAIITSFVNLYDMQAWILRPANIVGPRSTHGVILDFIKGLRKYGSHLRILGSGRQYKSYLYIKDVIKAIYIIWQKGQKRINLYNLSSDSYVTVNNIAKIIVSRMGQKKVKFIKTGGGGGWKGDVPIVKLDNKKIKKLGWEPEYTSEEAIKKTVNLLLKNNA